jgi:MYXO-CTERM domain-containing protein
VLLALLSQPAAACGGFACDQLVPVLQSAERIVFGLHEDTGEVEMHVQITYEGEASAFAWVVPVPAAPEVFLTSGALFNQLAVRTAPTFQLLRREEGSCRDRLSLSFGSEHSINSGEFGAPMSAGGGVVVEAEAQVGPYDTVTLQATSVQALLGWLADNDYALPPGSDGVIAPYVADGAHFLALKLAKDKDTGDLAPLALRYRASKPMVPVQLTSVSATPDMRMEVYAFADTRVVPESYLHVRINDAAVDWWGFGQNYPDVITEAADEAGGHAFATDYYGEVDLVGDLILEDRFDEAALRASADPIEWVERLRSALPVFPPELALVLEDQLGLEPGQGVGFWNCPPCGDPAAFVGTADEATDDLLEQVIGPVRQAQVLLDTFPRLSRMTSSLDAVEMTVDPVFVANPDMAEPFVANLRQAELVYECGNGRDDFHVPRRLVLKDGREIELPSEQWFSRNGTTELEYIEELGDQKAQIIEQTGATGQPRIIADYTEDLFELVRLHNALVGCGCDSGGASGPGALVGLLGLVVLRRRRA